MFITACINSRENQSSSYTAAKLYVPSEFKGKNWFEKDRMEKEWNYIQAAEEVEQQKLSDQQSVSLHDDTGKMPVCSEFSYKTTTEKGSAVPGKKHWT